MSKIGRNGQCHCGSGKKYKKCCMAKDEAIEAQVKDAMEVKKKEISSDWTT
ncbi:conserved hypothetical protein [Heliomicrobium modesticaldum Ice1]|uniref:Uncharacterized protein n=1 Tax=Heliobacterium modesticaldum (strain ATCC 51547 / Ice1) TaxID=498761 RepID=B0TB37_HELMI|nr:conserved hypothetical protein [Heliomicrobium modesticaldum Ice1]